ncbi:bone morphogenetic protein 2-like [Haliotis rufescens]|uniref:bone morphogenetic protein 2-like n=1 Tax=Haliotis rufescens TaxID=6454 RepID=UPI001EAFA770|nr:bone morphogenetic protein 2-like [Haliotis rufescens]
MENVVCDRLTGARSSTIARIWCAMFLYIMVTRIVGVDGLTKRSRPTDAIDRLSKVFGISKIPARIFHRSPPQYMTELYNSITETGGLTTKAGPYNADVVRSFPDKDSVHRMHFHYNVSQYGEEGSLLEAEFHIFKMKPRPSEEAEMKPTHLIEMKIYQVLSMEEMFQPKGLRLLDARRVSAHVHGWQKFRVKRAVEAWLNDTTTNFGLLVTTTSLHGHHVNGSYIRFAQRNEHHDSKQPILVVFTEEHLQRHPNFIKPEDAEYLEIKRDIEAREQEKVRRKELMMRRKALRFLNEGHRARMMGMNPAQEDSRIMSALKQSQGGRGRTKRSTGQSSRKGNGRKKRTFDMISRYRNRRTCSKQQMYVDFDEIGWSGWIISPKGYNAYHCTGECPFPLGQSQKPTNHATVQSIVHALRVGKDVGTPCCVPNKLYSISLLYFDDDENVILKQYDDMVAATCGCH